MYPDLAQPESTSGTLYHLDGANNVAGPQVHAAEKEVQYEAKIDHLRHSRFVGLRDDKEPREVHKES